MNVLIISTFSCTFEEFKTDVSGFITGMGQEVVSEYEFVQAGEHKSHLLMNVLDMQFHLRPSNKQTDRKGDKYRVVNCYPNKDPKKSIVKTINTSYKLN